MPITHRDTLTEGQRITCVNPTGLRARLTAGKGYSALHGLEAGIFDTSPFVTVIDDVGDHATVHAARFTVTADNE